MSSERPECVGDVCVTCSDTAVEVTVLRLLADSSKAKKLLGFESKVALHEGIVRLREWYVSQAKSPEQLLEEEVVRNWEPRPVPTHA